MAVPKIFQTFNSLLGGIVRKRNATIVGPSRQLVGEFPEVDFEKLYQYYHHWDQVKTAVDVMHQKFRGSGISITSNNEYFNKFIDRWWDISNAEKKWSQFIYSLLITGSAIMEVQHTPDGRIGSIEQIPMQTIHRLFRDQYGNELKLVQIVDGVFKELDPEFFIHHTINNPDRQAFGKSMFHTLASPRPVSGTVDPVTGDPINSGRNTMSLLDAQAVLQNAEIEIKKKMAKPRLIVSANGMPRDQMDAIQSEMADENTDQYIWIFDKPVQSAELQVAQNGRFGDYADNIDAHIDVGTVFASNVIKNPQGFSYSGGQTPLDVLDQRMIDLQGDLAEIMKDQLIRPLAESWGFKEFDMMEVKITFTPIIKRLTMDDIRGLDPQAVSAKEKRELYKKLNIELDDNMYEEEKNEVNQQQGGGVGGMMGGMPPAGQPPAGQPPAVGGMPINPVETKGTDVNKNTGIQSPKIDTATIDQQISPKKDDFTIDAPEPDNPPVPKIDQRKPKGETLYTRLMKEIATESKLNDKQKIEAIKALERIPLPPSAISTSTDLYVGQGVDQEGKPEITDPAVRMEFGLDKDESELPPSAPQFNAEIGNHHQGGTGNDGINKDSDGTFKDPTDANDDLEVIEEEQAVEDPHARPVQEPMVNMSGGSEPFPDNTKDQIIGSTDDDEPPYAPSELDPNDLEKEEDDKEDEEAEEAIEDEDKKDVVYGEDPFTSGTSEDPNPEPEERKEFPRVDDQPLTEEPNTFEDTQQDVVGDTSQARLHLEDQGLENPDRLQDSRYPFDNTGLNVKPEYQTVSEDEFAQVQTGEDPLEEEGEPFEDGMIVKPEDVRQSEPEGFDPENPVTQEISEDEYNEEMELSNADMNDPTISGIDEEQVDPDILHQDPETGKMYTDLTDEQGNEVPDLRFDQTPDSDEKQPEIELEFEIITKDEYDQEMSQDEFDQELENPNMEKPNPFGDEEDMSELDSMLDDLPQSKEENPLDPVETDEEGNPIELEDVDGNEIDQEQTDQESLDQEQIDEYEEIIDDMTDRINKLEKAHKLDKKISKMEDRRKATVKDIIKREHDLLEKGVPEEEIHDLLEQEFGDKRFNSAKETKTWRKAHGE
jgi:topoisomerase-4 subunit A